MMAIWKCWFLLLSGQLNIFMEAKWQFIEFFQLYIYVFFKKENIYSLLKNDNRSLFCKEKIICSVYFIYIELLTGII